MIAGIWHNIMMINDSHQCTQYGLMMMMIMIPLTSMWGSTHRHSTGWHTRRHPAHHHHHHHHHHHSPSHKMTPIIPSERQDELLSMMEIYLMQCQVYKILYYKVMDDCGGGRSEGLFPYLPKWWPSWRSKVRHLWLGKTLQTKDPS